MSEQRTSPESSPVADGGGGPRQRDGGGERLPYRSDVRATDRATVQAKSLRSDMSKPEVILWQHLRRQQLDGLRFRRQHPIGPYIVDFYCAEIAMVIEVDGASHQGERRRRDIERDAWMTERRLHILRVRAIDVLGSLDSVLATIWREAERLRKTPPPPADAGTSPVGDGGG